MITAKDFKDTFEFITYLNSYSESIMNDIDKVEKLKLIFEQLRANTKGKTLKETNLYNDAKSKIHDFYPYFEKIGKPIRKKAIKLNVGSLYQFTGTNSYSFECRYRKNGTESFKDGLPSCVQSIFINNEITESELKNAITDYKLFQNKYAELYSFNTYVSTFLIEFDGYIIGLLNVLIQWIELDTEQLNSIDWEFLEQSDNGKNELIIKRFDKMINDTNKVLKDLEQSEKPHKSTEEQQSQFSVIEWATIFYYAESVQALEGKTNKEKIQYFMNQYGINTSEKSFSNLYYQAKKRINGKSDYPIEKLELIRPFFEEHYPLAKEKFQNDIDFLKTEAEERKKNEY